MSLARYAEYKESGVAWLGNIPTTWEVRRVKNTTYLKGRVGWKGLTSEEYLDNGYAYLVTGTDFSAKFINWRACHCVEKVRYEDDPFIQLREGDLLITKDGTIGKLALVSGLDRPACLNSGIFLIRPTGSYITAYMYWVLQSESFKVFCDLSSLGSTIQHLYQNVFENFSFAVPPLEEQRLIAAFLDHETGKIDALIAEQEKLVTLLAEKRQATVSHAVTRGLNPEVPMKDSAVPWLGKIPVNWEIRRVKSVSSFTTSGPRGWSERIGDDGSIFVQSGDLDDSLGIEFETAKRVTVQDDAEANRTQLKAGDVVVCITGAKTGNVAVCTSISESAYVNQHLCLIRPRPNVIPLFLGTALKSRIGQTQFVLSQYGLKQGLSLENVREAWIVLPPLAEQSAILSFLEAETNKLDTLKSEAGRAIALLKERRNALIAAVVTGQIDVCGVQQLAEKDEAMAA
jgi:type I restriction enzyme S subunit